MSAKFTNPLSNIEIASPCSKDWNEMIGTDRKRFCGECKLNVYNLSGMTRAEAQTLLLNSEERLCVRFYKRADGTVLTKDCPVGWQAIKRRVSRTTAALASLAFGIIGGLGFAPDSSQSENANTNFLPVLTTPTPIQLMGAIAMPTQTPKATPMPKQFVMGEIAIQTPMPKATLKIDNDREMIMGKISVQQD